MKINRMHRSYILLVISIFVSCMALLVLVGWGTKVDALLSIVPGMPTMKFNSALCFLFSALCLLFYEPSGGGLAKTSLLYALASIAIGFTTLLQYVFDVDMGIDQAFITDYVSQSAQLPHPGRMSEATATCFSLFGIAFFLFNTKKSLWIGVGQYLLHIVSFLSLVAITNYLYGLHELGRIPFFSTMALHTSIFFGLLSAAASLIHPEHGLVGLFSGKLAGNWLARNLFPQFGVAVLLLGFLRALTHRYNLIPESFGISLLTISFLIMALVLLYRASIILNRVDKDRETAQTALKVLNHELEEKVKQRTRELELLNEQLNLASKGGKVGLWSIHLGSKSLDINHSLREIWGFGAKEEVSVDDLRERTFADDRNIADAAFLGPVHKKREINFEHRIVRPDKTVRWIRVVGHVFFDEFDSPSRIAGAHFDITEQKQTELMLEESNKRNRVFVEQSPSAVAMFDTDMKYLAASDKWKEDYGLNGRDIIGKSHYEIFPEIGDDWKKIHRECLKGSINRVDQAPFVRADGTTQWLTWEVRPWYEAEGIIGGLLMYTGDITALKKQQEETRHLETILKKAGETARIGAWEVNLADNTIAWDKVTREIHEVDDNYQPELGVAINFFKEGESRTKISEAVDLAIAKGQPYDLEVELVTATGKQVWARAVGQAEFENGQCKRLFGVFQDIDSIKRTSLSLQLSEKQFRGAFEYSAIGMALVSVEGRWKRVNDRLCQMIGYTKDELMSLTFQDITHPDDLETDLTLAKKVLAGEIDTYQMEKRYFHKQGEIVWVLLNVSLVRDEKGEPLHFISQIEDITARKNALKALSESEQRWKFALEGAEDGVWDWHLPSDKVFYSDRSLQIIGRAREELHPDSGAWDEFLHPDDRSPYFAEMKKHLDGETDVYNLEYRVRHKDGNYVWILDRGKAVEFDDNGKPTRVIGTHSDVTWRKQKEKELLHSFDIISEQNKRLLNFAHIVSHNLRSHSGNLEMMINLISMAESPEEKDELIAHLTSISTSLTETIHNLNEVVKIQVDINTQREDLNLRDYLAKTIQVLAGNIRETNAKITVNIPKQATVNYNRAYLESILLNFLSNAIKYRDPKRRPEIKIDLLSEGNFKILQITDNGLGIDLNLHSEKLFGMYKTFHGNADAKGIGLFITKNQIESMGGKVEVDSKVGSGTTFKIYLT